MVTWLLVSCGIVLASGLAVRARRRQSERLERRSRLLMRAVQGGVV